MSKMLLGITLPQPWYSVYTAQCKTTAMARGLRGYGINSETIHTLRIVAEHRTRQNQEYRNTVARLVRAERQIKQLIKAN